MEERNVSCPLGIENRKDIEASNQKFTIMLENLDEKMDQLNDTMKENFQELNNKIDKVDTRLDAVHSSLEKKVNRVKEDLPELIDERISLADKNKVWNVVKWVVVSLVGSTVISVVTRFVLTKLGLQ